MEPMDIYKSCENRNPVSKRERSQGFSLVEVVITLGLVTFCLVAILGTLPQSLNVVQDANREAEASRLLKCIMVLGIGSLIIYYRQAHG